MAKMLHAELGWFAWYPVRTCNTRKWYWLRRVNRFRIFRTADYSVTPWAYVVPDPDAGNDPDNPVFRTNPKDD